MRVLVVFIALLLVFASIAVFVARQTSTTPYTFPLDVPPATVFVADTLVHVLIADTPAEHRRGLSGREQLEPNQGMLFIFDTDDVYRIWMKDMLFPIDVLWIARDGAIVTLKENIEPETYPNVFSPQRPVRYVLELPAGFIESHKIHAGDQVVF